jgi:phage terminase small subunit
MHPRRLNAPPPARNVHQLRPPPAPTHLAPPEQRFWESVCQEYGLDGDVALQLLATACDALAMARVCREAVVRDGAMVTNDRGRLQANPLLREAAVARNSFLACMRALGLDIGPGQ